MSELDRDELRQIITALADNRRRHVAHGPELDHYLAGIDDLAAELIGRGHVRAPTSSPRDTVIVLSNPDTGRRHRRQDA